MTPSDRVYRTLRDAVASPTLTAQPETIYATPVARIGVHEWRAVVYVHPWHGRCVDYLWRRVDQNRGIFRRSTGWPTHDGNDTYGGMPKSLGPRVFDPHRAGIEAALKPVNHPAEHAGDDAPKDHPRADAHPVAAAESRPADAMSAAGRPGPAAAVGAGVDSWAAATHPLGYSGVRSTNYAAGVPPAPGIWEFRNVGRFDPIPDDEARERLTAAGYRLESRGILPYFKPGGGTVRLQTYRLAHPGDGRCGLRIDGVTFPLCRDSLERHEKAARDAAAGSRAANLADLLGARMAGRAPPGRISAPDRLAA